MRSMMQMYVKGSVEAFKLYQKAFDAKIGYEAKNDDGDYMHAELNAFGQILAISELEEHTVSSNRMQFCFHLGKDKTESVKKAYEILKIEAQVMHPLGKCEYSPCMFSLIDKFGVNWCIFE